MKTPLVILAAVVALAGGAAVAEAGSPGCADWVDSDVDGRADYPRDPGCSSASEEDESDSGLAETELFPNATVYRRPWRSDKGYKPHQVLDDAPPATSPPTLPPTHYPPNTRSDYISTTKRGGYQIGFPDLPAAWFKWRINIVVAVHVRQPHRTTVSSYSLDTTRRGKKVRVGRASARGLFGAAWQTDNDWDRGQWVFVTARRLTVREFNALRLIGFKDDRRARPVYNNAVMVYARQEPRR